MTHASELVSDGVRSTLCPRRCHQSRDDIMLMSTIMVLALGGCVGLYYNGHLDDMLKAAPPVTSVLFYSLCGVAVLTVVCGVAFLYLASCYSGIIKDNHFDIDAYVGDPSPSLKSRAKVAFIHYFVNVGSHKASRTPIPLESYPSPFFKGLQVTAREGTQGVSAKPFDGKGAPIVVGTIRMGFGHHRIAYAAASWGVASGRPTFFHDLLNVDSAEATMIREMDKGYSQASRLATEMGGAVEALWGSLTRGADENMLRASYQFAENLLPLLLSIPKDTPLISTHCFVGLIAVALGFTNVINLVIDNHAQWFIVVPGAHNLVQGPSNYHSLLRMGVPAEQLQLAGHWIPKDLVDGIDADCNARIKRAEKRAPIRILIPVGGAGAQKTFVSTFLRALKGLVAEGRVELMLNAGDHEHMRVAFVEALSAMGVTDYNTVDTMEGVHDFANRLRTGKPHAQAACTCTCRMHMPHAHAHAACTCTCRMHKPHAQPAPQSRMLPDMAATLFAFPLSNPTPHPPHPHAQASRLRRPLPSSPSRSTSLRWRRLTYSPA